MLLFDTVVLEVTVSPQEYTETRENHLSFANTRCWTASREQEQLLYVIISTDMYGSGIARIYETRSYIIHANVEEFIKGRMKRKVE